MYATSQLLNEDPDIVDSEGATDIPFYTAAQAQRASEGSPS